MASNTDSAGWNLLTATKETELVARPDLISASRIESNTCRNRLEISLMLASPQWNC